MIALLDKKHNRENFDCGNPILNNYLKTQAGQDIKRKLSACFVLSNNKEVIQGYYTLSNHSIPLDVFPEKIQKKLPPSYRSIPATLLGRLAVDKNFQNKGIGKILLIDALKRCYEVSKEMGSFAVVVDPIDKSAAMFYQKFDFISLPDSKKMFIAIQSLQQLFG